MRPMTAKTIGPVTLPAPAVWIPAMIAMNIHPLKNADAKVTPSVRQ